MYSNLLNFQIWKLKPRRKVISFQDPTIHTVLPSPATDWLLSCPYVKDRVRGNKEDRVYNREKVPNQRVKLVK